MYRGRPNHMNPTLEEPGSHGTPNTSRALQSFAYPNGDEVRPSPYGDIPLQITNPEYLVGSYLTTGNRFHKGFDKALPKTKEFNYPRKNMAVGRFPQSKPMRDGRCSNFDTYFDPNEHPVPIMLDLLDAQRVAYVSQEDADKARKLDEEIPDFDKTPDFIYLHSREDENINQYFANLSESFNQDRINRLIQRGFSEDEIARYIDKEREKDIEKAIKNPDDPEVLMRASLAKHMKDRKVAFVHPTGTNASGIGSRSDIQSIHTVTMPTKTPQTLKKERREAYAKKIAMRGSDLARDIIDGYDNNFGREDPRDAVSALLGADNRGRAPAMEAYLSSSKESKSSAKARVGKSEFYKRASLKGMEEVKETLPEMTGGGGPRKGKKKVIVLPKED